MPEDFLQPGNFPEEFGIEATSKHRPKRTTNNEQRTTKMRDLTDVEYDILNVVYFVEPFEKIVAEVNFPENIIADSLKYLITHKMVSAMKWDPIKNDHVKTFYYDSDNMRAFSYIITRVGLLAHNSR